MTDKDQKSGKSGFSLQDEIKKRKTQEVQRAMEQGRVTDPRRTSQTGSTVPRPPDVKRASQTTGGAPATPDPHRVSPTLPSVQSSPDARRVTQNSATVPDPRRATQTARPVSDPRRTSQSVTVDKRATQAMPVPVRRSRRNLLIAAIASVLVVAVLGGSFLLARDTVSTLAPTPTAMAVLPIVRADEVVGYLKNANVPISNFRQLPVDKASWVASEEVQFDVQRGGNKATFLILSYASADRAVSDNFRAKSNARFKDWQIISISNILLLTSPDAAPDIKSEMSSHMTSFLLAPYRPFLPTATTQPATAATAEATQ